jgi:hypothetical protein
MTRQTRELLKELEEAAWFAVVGRPLAEAASGSVVLVSSWEDALACYSSQHKWSCLKLEQGYELRAYLQTHAPDRRRAWNLSVREVKKSLLPLVQKKTRPVVRRLTIPQAATVQHAAECDILGACMELEYSDVRPPGFYCSLVLWYLGGRFPCGWGERLPAGEVRLYGPEESEYDPNEPDWLKRVLANQERLFHPKVRLPTKGKLVVY